MKSDTKCDRACIARGFYCSQLLKHSTVWSENAVDVIQLLVDAKVFHIFFLPVFSVQRFGVIFIEGTRYDTIRYDTIEEINVDSKAEYTA